MKSIISKTMCLVLIIASLASFTTKPGGEGFEIFLNNKVVLQQFGNEMKNVKTLSLAQSSPHDELTIKYHHCGQVGKDRVVTIKDAKDAVLKEFRFTNASTRVSGMTVKLKDILSLKKGNSTTLKLYYSSSELPGGRMLATINAVTNSTAGR